FDLRKVAIHRSVPERISERASDDNAPPAPQNTAQFPCTNTQVADVMPNLGNPDEVDTIGSRKRNRLRCSCRVTDPQGRVGRRSHTARRLNAHDAHAEPFGKKTRKAARAGTEIKGPSRFQR